MGLAYYALEDDLPTVPPPPVKVQKPPQNLFEGEQTECNYIVMFFILGVIFLAISDSARR